MSMPGPMELVVIAGIALLIFGPARLPQLGRSLGSSLKEFREAVNNVGKDLDTTLEKAAPKSDGTT